MIYLCLLFIIKLNKMQQIFLLKYGRFCLFDWFSFYIFSAMKALINKEKDIL